MASLCLLDQDGAKTKRWELDRHPIDVGRDDAADVVIADGALSRRHFRIVPENGHYLLKDLDSENGTWVDGRPASNAPLRHHDCIAAGRTLFLFDDRPRHKAASHDGSNSSR